MNIPQPHSTKVHVFCGTENTLTIHTMQRILAGDQIPIGKRMIIVTEVTVKQNSHYFLNHNFYELKFKIA